MYWTKIIQSFIRSCASHTWEVISKIVVVYFPENRFTPRHTGNTVRYLKVDNY